MVILPQVEDLARVSFKKAPLYIGVDDDRSKATVEGLEQGYCVVSSAERFLLLFTFLKKNLKKKACFVRQAFSGAHIFLIQSESVLMFKLLFMWCVMPLVRN